MPIRVNLDQLLHDRQMTLSALADAVDITPANLSILKTGKARAMRFSTLDAICRVLHCQPGDLLEWTDRVSDSPTASSETSPSRPSPSPGTVR